MLEALTTAGQMLAGNDPDSLRSYLQSFGIIAPLVSIALMIFQAVVAPLPAFGLSLANGYLFGALAGGALSLIGGCLAAMLCYELARWLGRERLSRIAPKARLEQAEAWLERWGIWALAGLRLVPFLPFDPLSYAMGLSPMGRRQFVLANLLGQLPGAFFYAVLGAGLWPGL